MGYTNTVSRNMTPSTALPLDVLDAKDPALHRGKAAFFFLWLFTAILFGRPADLVHAVAPIPLAQIVAIMAIAAYGLAFLRGELPLILTRELKIVFALTFCFMMGIPFAYWRSNSLELFFQGWLKVLVIFFLLTQLVFTTDRLRKLIWTMILCMFFIAVYSLLESPVLDPDGRLRGAAQGFFSGNYLGIAVGVMLPYIAALLTRSRSFIKSMVLVSAFGTVMLMTVRTASRGSMICVIISLLLVWALILRSSFKARMMGVGFALAIVAAVLLAPGIFWDRVSTLWDKEAYATSTASGSAIASELQRKMLLVNSVVQTLEHPVFGLGMGNFQIQNGTMTRNSQAWKGTHNTYTEISSETGIPALLLFLALLITCLRNMKRVHEQCRERPEMSELGLLARATQVSIFVFMLGGFFAHLGFEYYVYYLAGFAVALHSVFERAKNRLSAEPAKVNRPATYGRNEGVGRLRNGNGVKGRAW